MQKSQRPAGADPIWMKKGCRRDYPFKPDWEITPREVK